MSCMRYEESLARKESYDTMIDYWKNKKVVVTGGAGFLGSFVVDQLRRRGCKIIIVPRMQDYNLVNKEAVQKLYQDSHPDLLIHIAAKVGGIGANRKSPGEFFYDNLMMGANVVEEGRKFGVKKLVLISTICAYPKFAAVPFKEDEIWNGYPEETNAPYGLAKKMLLVQSLAYRQQYGMNSIVLLPTNLYGPRDNFDLDSSHVIPAMIRKILKAKQSGSESIEVWGTGSAAREFLYVEDCAEAIVLASEKYEKSDPVNLGTGSEIFIKELVVLLCRLLDYKGDIVWDSSKPDGQPRRCLDTSRALKEFGFKAKTDLETGLKKTIEWYKSIFK